MEIPEVTAGPHSPKPVFVRRFTKNEVNRLTGGPPEVRKMDLEADTAIPLVERTLAMPIRGRERWCLEWAHWLWAQEIEIAVYQAKQR
jgi:hypothetical protein